MKEKNFENIKEKKAKPIKEKKIKNTQNLVKNAWAQCKEKNARRKKNQL